MSPSSSHIPSQELPSSREKASASNSDVRSSKPNHQATVISGWLEGLGGWPVAFAFCSFAIILSFCIHRHVLWRDEAAPWLLARDNNLAGMLHSTRYEGHPPLWFLMVYGICHLTANPEWIKLPNLLAALAIAWMILTVRSLSLPTRVGIVFSYFILFEYGQISRNYTVGVACLLGAALLMRENRRDLLIALLLSCAALSSLPALIVASCLYVYFLWPSSMWPALQIKDDVGGVDAPANSAPLRRYQGMLLFAAAAAWSAIMIWPPADSGSILLRDKSGFAHRIIHVLLAVTTAYLSFPGRRVKFWNTSFLDQEPVLAVILGLMLTILLCLFFRVPRVRLVFIGTSLLLLLQIAFTGRAFMRHVGWLFVVFVIALLFEQADHLGEFLKPPSEIPGRKSWRAWLLAGILLVQVASGAYATLMDLRHPFAADRQMAEFLKQRGLANQTLVCAANVTCQSVLAYSRKPSAYYPEIQGMGSYIVWNQQAVRLRHMPSPEELQSLTDDGTPVLLLMVRPLAPLEAFWLGVTPVVSFTDTTSDETMMFLYRRTPDRPPSDHR